MELYISISFWVGILGLFIRMVWLSKSEYPRVQNHKMGADVVTFILQIAIVMWAGSLLFGA